MPSSPITSDHCIAERIRSQFPALQSPNIFLENAGGSQIPQSVADRMREYMLSTFVQLGAGYDLSRRCDEVIEQAHEFVSLLMNVKDCGRVILGPSSTQLCMNLSSCYAKLLQPGDEVIVVEIGHEANIGPWMRLAQSGATVRIWRVDPNSLRCELTQLDELLSTRTSLVAVVHVSNLLGEIIDLKPIVERVHAVGARLIVDGVAYAPHRAIDVSAWDVDWYFFSTYKVFGPHMAAMYGRHDAFAELEPPNHFFIPHDQIPYAFEPGGVNHEACAGLMGTSDYFGFLAEKSNANQPAQCNRAIVEHAFSIMTELELPLQQRLIEYLKRKTNVKIIGPNHGDINRIGTISFVHSSISSQEITAHVHAHNIGIRHGHMYAYRLCEALDIDPDDGVVRVSLVHYNTLQEIDRLIEVLEHIL